MTIPPMTIVIPSRNIALLTRAVQSILSTHQNLEDWELVVVDDGLSERPRFVDATTYLDGVKPFCYATNVNLAFNHVTPDRDVVVMNDDTQFLTTEGLNRLRRAAYSRPKLGLLAPLCVPPDGVPPHMLNRAEAVDELWIHTDHHLVFPAGYFKRELIRQVGLLDESFTGYGYDDNDYCLRACLAGFEFGVLPSVILAHGEGRTTGSATFRTKPDFQTLFAANRARFVRKWATSFLGVTEDQAERLLWFTEFNFGRSPLTSRASALFTALRPPQTTGPGRGH